MVAILLACVAMAFKDAMAVLLVVAEAKGRAWLAGGFDAGGDLASILVTLAGAGEIIVHGWSVHTIVLLACMMSTSVLGTALWTRVGKRIRQS